MYKKIIFLSLMISQFCIASFANYVDETLSNIELNQYGRTYIEDSIGSRLSRLETDFFGMTQSGSVENRIYGLEKMASVNKFVPQFQEDLFGDRRVYFNEEKPSKIRKFFDTISSPFTSYGTVTGYTPPLTGYSYNNHYQNFNNGYCPKHNTYHLNQNRLHRHHPHYRTGNYPYSYRPENAITNVSTRSSIKILD